MFVQIGTQNHGKMELQMDKEIGIFSQMLHTFVTRSEFSINAPQILDPA